MKFKIEVDTQGLGAYLKEKLKRMRVGLLFLLVLVPLVGVAAVSKPFTFVDGDTISAAQINATFDALYNTLNSSTFTAEFAKNNWKQCSFKLDDSTDNGATAFNCDYTKKLDTSALKLTWSGSLRSAYQCNACCSIWTIRVNGNECTSPGVIDAVAYSHVSGASWTDFHHERTFVGVCTATAAGPIKAGNHNVRIYVRPCDGYAQNDSHTGWNSASRIIIEELP